MNPSKPAHRVRRWRAEVNAMAFEWAADDKRSAIAQAIMELRATIKEVLPR